VRAALTAISAAAAAETTNLMPLLIDAARAHVSEGEIVDALQAVWGDYREAPAF
jgi:methylmalonyl-CoA mutase N-terminal domain/subunit